MKANEYMNEVAVYAKDVESILAADGVKRRILAYTDELMCVENVFDTGAVGAIHTHPHTQLTYVVSGKFRFTVGEDIYEVKAGDTLLKRDGVVHGCTALEGGILLDIFTPMRDDFIK